MAESQTYRDRWVRNLGELLGCVQSGKLCLFDRSQPSLHSNEVSELFEDYQSRPPER